MPRLHSVPVLLVAITQNNTCQLVREAENSLLRQLKKSEFIQVSEDDFDSESLSLHVVVICVSLSFSASIQFSRTSTSPVSSLDSLRGRLSHSTA